MFDVEKVGATVFTCVGLLILFAGCFLIKHTSDFRKTAHVVPGVVVELVPREDLYATKFEFQDEAGTTHRVTSSDASSPPAYKIGERVQVGFAPGKPEKARIDGFMENWFFAIIAIFMGLLLSGIGLGTWHSIRNRPEKSQT